MGTIARERCRILRNTSPFCHDKKQSERLRAYFCQNSSHRDGVMAPNAAEMPGGGAKQAYSDREPSSSLRLHRRERGIREQLEPMPSRHEVIESFRQEALLQRGRYAFAKRNALHRQRLQSRQLAHEFSSERPALGPGETQVSMRHYPTS